MPALVEPRERPSQALAFLADRPVNRFFRHRRQEMAPSQVAMAKSRRRSQPSRMMSRHAAETRRILNSTCHWPAPAAPRSPA
jgi:hypothetical protein